VLEECCGAAVVDDKGPVLLAEDSSAGRTAVPVPGVSFRWSAWCAPTAVAAPPPTRAASRAWWSCVSFSLVVEVYVLSVEDSLSPAFLTECRLQLAGVPKYSLPGITYHGGLACSTASSYGDQLKTSRPPQHRHGARESKQQPLVQTNASPVQLWWHSGLEGQASAAQQRPWNQKHEGQAA
jgi:hypothetical protein